MGMPLEKQSEAPALMAGGEMKKLIMILTFFSSISAFAQGEFMTLREMGNSLGDIIPEGWRILDSKSGDLNKDGISDLVFAIQSTDPKNIELNNGLGTDTVDLNPRMLGIYFGTKSGIFKQILVSDDFIILRDSPTMDEPFEGLNISRKGALEINFKFWYSAGSWSTSRHQYKFRFQDDAFVLIGYESSESHRASGETTDYSINFLTGKMKIKRINFSSDIPVSVERKKFKLDKSITIKTLKRPFELEFEGIYL